MRTKHSGDCHIYSDLINGNPEDGVCTCGFGLQLLSETGDQSEMYSDELQKVEYTVRISNSQKAIIDEISKKVKRGEVFLSKDLEPLLKILEGQE